MLSASSARCDALALADEGLGAEGEIRVHAVAAVV
jgi:hypothetical protein